jgi:periplasmic protein TonB
VSAPDDDPTLVIDLNGVIADTQAEQKVVEETKGEVTPQATPTAATAQAVASAEQPMAAEAESPAPAQSMQALTPPRPETKSADARANSADAGANNVRGAIEQQNPQTIKADHETEADPFQAYVKLLAKKIEANLVYPDAGREAGLQGTAVVSFTILGNGQIRPETLKVIDSSGQPKLDASALKTIRACVPFAPPPRETTVAIAVGFGRKH